MADIIQLLPDFVANQIAAGEVIQRPASVVKELMENAVDAGATQVHLIVKDSGRTLLQIIDDGCGMSAADARLCFERHATSKISSAEDLFRIRTKGFRGEALASIGSVAHVELKTRLHDEELGTRILMEGSDVRVAEPCQTAQGTSFSVRNLFFNVPARRQFLKTDAIEFKHILDEFQRIALAHPEVAFIMHHNQSEVYHLLRGNFRQRVVALFGVKLDERLVPVDEDTDVVRITGFVGKPEFARKSRGEQFFFVNGRFIKHPYLHHALSGAMDGLMSEGKYPLYFLHLEVDPSRIDVNIHPTKTEVKFREEKAIYSILKSAVRRGLGRFQIAPTLDFEQESSFNIAPFDKDRPVVVPEVAVNLDYNPFANEAPRKEGLAARLGRERFTRSRGYDDFYRILQGEPMDDAQPESAAVHMQQAIAMPADSNDEKGRVGAALFQMARAYIITPIKSGMLWIDQQRAHERILYEKYYHGEDTLTGSQQLLFPETVTLTPAEHAAVLSARESLGAFGFEVEDLGGRDIIIHGVPVDLSSRDPRDMLESVLKALQEDADDVEHPVRHRLALGLARAGSIKRGQVLSDAEMRDLIDRLFTCAVPAYTPTGRKVVVTFTPEEMANKFD